MGKDIIHNKINKWLSKTWIEVQHYTLQTFEFKSTVRHHFHLHMSNDPKVWISEETNMPNCGWSICKQYKLWSKHFGNIYQNLELTYPEIQPQRNKTNRIHRYTYRHRYSLKGALQNWLTQSVICKLEKQESQGHNSVQVQRPVDHGAADVNPGDQVPRTRSSKSKCGR